MIKTNSGIYDINWFKKNKKWLLKFANFPIIGVILLKYMTLYSRIKKGDRISDIGPNYITQGKNVDGVGKMGTVVFSFNLISENIAKKFFVLIIILHVLDYLFIDRWVPQYSFGLAGGVAIKPDKYNDSSPTTTDGKVVRGTPLADVNWAGIRSVGASGDMSAVVNNVGFGSELKCTIQYSSAGYFNSMERGFMSFDCSNIGVPHGEEVTDITVRLYLVDKFENYDSILNSTRAGTQITEWDPLFNNPEELIDWSTGNTSDYIEWTYDSTYSYLAITSMIESRYNEYPINKNAISRRVDEIVCVAVQVKYDVDNVSPPTTSSDNNSSIQHHFGSAENTAQEPNLYVEWDSISSNIIMML